MKVEIKKDGKMYISCETELESYALEKWSENGVNLEDIVIDISI